MRETVLLCHSFGGFVRVRTAFAAPERVCAAVAFETVAGLAFSDAEEQPLLWDSMARYCAYMATRLQGGRG